jgi:hypothetical protein
VHDARRISPPGARSPRGSNDQPPGVRLQLDFLGQLRLLQQSPGHSDSLRIADSNDPRLGAHVITL